MLFPSSQTFLLVRGRESRFMTGKQHPEDLFCLPTNRLIARKRKGDFSVKISW